MTESGVSVVSHLTDFPIEPARLVPAAGILPAQVAASVGADEEVLTKALKSFGMERVGEVDVRPVPNLFEGPMGMAAFPDERSTPIGAYGDDGPPPRIVAMRLNGKRLRAWRVDAKLTQERLAEKVRDAGDRIGEPNGCTKRKVQTWENGEVRMPSTKYQRALESVTAMPFVALCTPIPPMDPDEATRELTAIAANFNELLNRMLRYYRYLTR